MQRIRTCAVVIAGFLSAAACDSAKPAPPAEVTKPAPPAEVTKPAPPAEVTKPAPPAEVTKPAVISHPGHPDLDDLMMKELAIPPDKLACIHAVLMDMPPDVVDRVQQYTRQGIPHGSGDQRAVVVVNAAVNCK